ncbi:hypothetical protein D9756_001359 [Leucocoprinus leucothites]|uniref:Monopolin complex subunit Csm1/Pcs1 C-terminal domain-containing protein n=1 Tax=Leucocoprinus leucothites TaxID=201217 RepID=A0A8H5G467_9AGAR|nr:hypothetical protein D9756_001359 [Leucoagaricus leucothites]
MSDDSVELGGFGPTTPAHPSIKPRPKPRTTAKPLIKQRANGAEKEPGPSKRTAANAPGRQTKRKKVEEEVVVESQDEVEEADGGEVQEAEMEETRAVAEDVVASSEDEMRVEVEKHLNGNNARTRGRVNGRTQQRQRTKPPSSSKLPPKSSKQVMEVQGSEEEENAGEEVIHIDVPPPRETRTGKAAVGRSRNQAKRKKESPMDEVLEGQDEIVALIDKIGGPAPTSSRKSGTTGAPASNVKDAETARLKEKISRLESENKALSDQLEELFRIRETEAEALLRRTDEQYQTRVRALEDLNHVLTDELSKKQPLVGLGRSTVFNLIPREVADAEKQTLEKEITKLKGEADDAAKTLSDKDQEIGQLKQLEKELRFELKAEIDRANSLAKQAPRHPHPTPRSGMVAEDPKHREAISLYEDLTNIIVLNIRSTPSSTGRKDEWQFTCCYTHTNESDSVNPATRSLSFTLRSYELLDDGGQHNDWIQYLPMSLEKEADAFRDKLGFLNSPFQFERNQLALFLRTLYTTVEDIVKADDESDDGERVSEGAT